jgi:hypothetical protein
MALPISDSLDFRVDAPVTQRTPHRPVLEDFPHTVPRFQPFFPELETKPAAPGLAHNFAAH